MMNVAQLLYICERKHKYIDRNIYRTGENDLKLVAVSHNLEYGLKRHVQPLLVEAQFSLRKPALFAQIFPTKLIACGLAQCICIGM